MVSESSQLRIILGRTYYLLRPDISTYMFEHLGVTASHSPQTGLKQGILTGVGCPESFCGYRPDYS